MSCREASLDDLKRAKHRLLKYLLRHGFQYTEGRHWTQKHFRWLQALKFENRMDELVFSEYLNEIHRRKDRRRFLEQEVEEVARQEPYRESVELLRCFHGIDTVSAMGIVSELFGFERFHHPRQRMSFLGLIPSEHSSGEKIRQGGITKAGNQRVRRILVEAAWPYRHRPGVGSVVKARRKGQPEWVIAQADRARQRLYRKYGRFVDKGKSPQQAMVAVARELAGFLWSVLHPAKADPVTGEFLPEREASSSLNGLSWSLQAQGLSGRGGIGTDP